MAYGTLKCDKIAYSDGSNPDITKDVSEIVDAAPATSPDFVTDITLTAAAPVKFNQTDNAAAVSLKAPGTGVTSYTITLPAVVGASGKVLKTSDGSGTLTWGDSFDLLDEDDFSTDSATAAASQQSVGVYVRSYVDTNFASKTAPTISNPTITGGIAFEGATVDDYETAFSFVDPTADRTITFTDATGTVPLLQSSQHWSGAQRGDYETLTSSSNSTAVNLSLSNNFNLTLGENSTLAQPSFQAAGQSGSITVTQDGTGSRTLAYHDDWKFAGGSTPVLSTAANAVDRIDYIVAATNKIHAVVTLDVKTGT